MERLTDRTRAAALKDIITRRAACVPATASTEKCRECVLGWLNEECEENWSEYAKMATPAEIAYTMYKLQNIIDAQKELLELRERQFEGIRLRQECLECKLKNCSQEERDK